MTDHDEPPRKKRRGPENQIYTTLGDPSRYTHHAVPQFRDRHPLRSGITPLTPPGKNATEIEKDIFRCLETYQRNRFQLSCGLTTAELDHLGALACTIDIDGDKAFSLEHVPIHPYLARTNWISPGPDEVKYELGYGWPGYWEASNDVVWKILAPCLRIVSLFLSNPAFASWWSALLGDSNSFERFQGKADWDDDATSVKGLRFYLSGIPRYHDVEEYFRNHAGESKCTILSGTRDIDGQEYLHGAANQKSCFGRLWKPRLDIAFQGLEPLLNSKNTPAERLVDTFAVAGIILHELAHIVGHDSRANLREVHRSFSMAEPYFEDDALPELGFAYEDVLFNGTFDSGISKIFRSPSTSDGFMLRCAPWDNKFLFRDYQDFKFPLPISKPPEWECKYMYPLPIAQIARFIQEDYWLCDVGRYGSKSTHFTQPVGTKMMFDSYWYPGPSSLQMPTASDSTSNITRKYTRAKDHGILVDRIKELIYKNHRELRYIDRYHFGAVVQEPSNLLYLLASTTRVPVEYFSNKELIPPKAPCLCPRFHEIESYLCANVTELALDTTMYKMPIMLLLQYIHQDGGIELHIDEWRNFLAVCEEEKFMFKYTPRDFNNYGSLIVRWRGGWPQRFSTDLYKKRPAAPMPIKWADSDEPARIEYLKAYFISDLEEIKNTNLKQFNEGRSDAEKAEVFFYMDFVPGAWRKRSFITCEDPLKYLGALRQGDDHLTLEQKEYCLEQAIKRVARLERKGLLTEHIPRVCHAPKGIVRILEPEDDFYLSDGECPPSPRLRPKDYSSSSSESEDLDDDADTDDVHTEYEGSLKSQEDEEQGQREFSSKIQGSDRPSDTNTDYPSDEDYIK